MFARCLACLVFLNAVAPSWGASVKDNPAFVTFETAVQDKYQHRHCFGDEAGKDVCMFWKINGEDLELAVATQATGWLGFGLAESGGMIGADIFYYEAETDTLTDAYATAYAKPVPDDCDSDWKLVDKTVDVENNFMAVEIVRALDTGDPQDRPLVEDSDLTIPPSAVIAAWGDDSGMEYHGGNKARSLVRFYVEGPKSPGVESVARASEITDVLYKQGSMATQLLEASSDGNILVHEDNYEIPAIETYYHYACFNVSDYFTAEQLEQGVHMIGMDYVPSVDISGVDNSKYLHHMVGMASFSPCTEQRMSNQILYSWTRGGQPLVFPSNVGIKLGGSNGLQSLTLNIHYDNRDEDTGKLDSTGIRWYYVTEPREHNAASILVGDAVVSLNGQSVGVGTTGHSFTCPGSCSEKFFDGPVTVYAEYLHEHEKGVRIVNEVRRNGELVNRASVESFDFPIYGQVPIQQKSFEVLPGDTFHTTCYFETSDNTTTWGFGSQEEMCQSLLFYYPADVSTQAYCSPNFYDPQCTATYEFLGVVENADRKFGSSRDACPNDPDDLSAAPVRAFWVMAGLVPLLFVALF